MKFQEFTWSLTLWHFKSLPHSTINGMSLLNPSQLRDQWRRGSQKIVKCQRWWVTPRKQHLPGTTGLTYVWIQRLWQHTRPAHVQTRQNLRTVKEKYTQIPLVTVGTYSERQNQFSPREYPWVYHSHFKVGFMTRSNCPMQNVLYGIFVWWAFCLIFFWGTGHCKGEWWIWMDWEMSGIGVHDAKFPKNQ